MDQRRLVELEEQFNRDKDDLIKLLQSDHSLLELQKKKIEAAIEDIQMVQFNKMKDIKTFTQIVSNIQAVHQLLRDIDEETAVESNQAARGITDIRGIEEILESLRRSFII